MSSMCTAITSSAQKRLSKSLSVRVCAEIWQGTKAVAAMQAAILLAATLIALVLQAVAQTLTQQLIVVCMFTASALFCIIKMLNSIKHSSAFRSKLGKADLLTAQALHLMSKSDDGIKVVDAGALALALALAVRVVHALKAAPARLASALRALASTSMRILISTTHSSDSLRRSATA